MANVLPFKVRVRVVEMLLAGLSARRIADATSAGKDTPISLGYDVGRGCARLHDRIVRGVRAEQLAIMSTDVLVRDPRPTPVHVAVVTAPATGLVVATSVALSAASAAEGATTSARARVIDDPITSTRADDAGRWLLGRVGGKLVRSVPHLTARLALYATAHALLGRLDGADRDPPAVRTGLVDQPWTVEELVRVALEEVGCMNPPPKATRPRRYERKTHAQDVDDPVIARSPRARRAAANAPKLLTEAERDAIEEAGLRVVRAVDVQDQSADLRGLAPMSATARERLHAALGGPVVGVSRAQELNQSGTIFFEVVRR